MGEGPAHRREPPRRSGATEQSSELLDWSQLEPFEEGRAGELPNDDTALFGDFASQLLEGRRPWLPRDVLYWTYVACEISSWKWTGCWSVLQVPCTSLRKNRWVLRHFCLAILFLSLASIYQLFFEVAMCFCGDFRTVLSAVQMWSVSALHMHCSNSRDSCGFGEQVISRVRPNQCSTLTVMVQVSPGRGPPFGSQAGHAVVQGLLRCTRGID